MKNKKIIKIILAVVFALILLCLGFILFQNQNIRPGIEGLSKKKVGIFYCSYDNDNLSTVISMIADAINANPVELKTNVLYPKDKKQFQERIAKEQENISRVTLENNDIDLLKYDYIIFGTPVINNRPCPVVQKFVLENTKNVAKKPVSVVILYKDGELPNNTLLFFRRKLALAVWQPAFISRLKDQKGLNSQLKMWLNMMSFKRKQLKHK